MQSREEILNLITSRAPEIRRFGVRGIALFGSVARGDHHEQSDLDFLVEFEKGIFDAYMDLKSFLEDLLGRKVDLVIKHALKPRISQRIQDEAVYAQGF
jgi:uncharacterized protein